MLACLHLPRLCRHCSAPPAAPPPRAARRGVPGQRMGGSCPCAHGTLAAMGLLQAHLLPDLLGHHLHLQSRHAQIKAWWLCCWLCTHCAVQAGKPLHQPCKLHLALCWQPLRLPLSSLVSVWLRPPPAPPALCPSPACSMHSSTSLHALAWHGALLATVHLHAHRQALAPGNRATWEDHGKSRQA